MSKDLFNYQILRPPSSWGQIVSGELLSPIPFNQLFSDAYFILPSFLDKATFGCKVEYVDDINEYYKDAISVKLENGRDFNIQIPGVKGLAKYKHRAWSFQSELRFVLFILPSIPIPTGGITQGDFVTRFVNHMGTCIIQGVPPVINCFDLEIATSVLDNIIVTLGPLSNEGDKLIVESLLSQHTKNGQCKDSALKGTIRLPMK